MRDRRFDFLYEREKQPVKRYIQERFAESLADELAAWPPRFVEWVSDELRRRWAAGLEARPTDEAIRFSLELARLDLRREFEACERLLEREGDRHFRTPEEHAAGHLLVRFLTEKLLGLKEYAEGARLRRDDLVEILDLVERRLFRVVLTPGGG
ncbi:MAG TPA: hypothetical protein VD838_05070 [Anaeromyxobacteraceae bacterium]|nr:hypothetical protein [Anaeromyxobacteraceae bacterium]